jgi:hypothetical protein
LHAAFFPEVVALRAAVDVERNRSQAFLNQFDGGAPVAVTEAVRIYYIWIHYLVVLCMYWYGACCHVLVHFVDYLRDALPCLLSFFSGSFAGCASSAACRHRETASGLHVKCGS